MGRVIKHFTRKRLQDQMRKLKKHYRPALKSNEMQEGFDALWEKWSSEMGARIYLVGYQAMSAMDLLLLGAAVDNRQVIEELRRDLEELKRIMI